MNPQPATSDINPADEELVAYLDGELDATDRQRVEQRLADDAAFRTRLRLLQRTWDALDVLRRTDPDEGFTRTTVELVAVKAAEEVRDEHSRLVQRRKRKWVGWTLAAVASSVAGWLLLTLLFTRSDRELLRDFFVIERVDEYRNAESLQFIQALDESGLFDSGPEAEVATVSTSSRPKNPDEAARRIENLKPEEKTRLIQKNERFTALSPQEQERLRRLHEQLEDAPRAGRLLTVLDRYSRWLKTLSAAQQSELMGLPIDERLARIREIQQQQIQSQFWDLAWQLEKDDLRTIDAWMEDFVARRQEEILTKIDPGAATWVLSEPDGRSRRGRLVWSVFAPWGGQRPIEFSESMYEDFRLLAERLSPTLQHQLTLQRTDEDRRKLILTCARFALYSRFAPPTPKDEELSRFYATKLPPEERERIEKLEPQQMKRELTKLYHRRLRDGGWRPPGSVAPANFKGSFGPSRRDGGRSRGGGRTKRENDADPAEQPAAKRGDPAEAEPPKKS